MQQNEFEILVKELCQKENLPQVLEALKACEDQDIVEAAESLAGQFRLAEVEGEQRIYHVFNHLVRALCMGGKGQRTRRQDETLCR